MRHGRTPKNTKPGFTSHKFPTSRTRKLSLKPTWVGFFVRPAKQATTEGRYLGLRETNGNCSPPPPAPLPIVRSFASIHLSAFLVVFFPELDVGVVDWTSVEKAFDLTRTQKKSEKEPKGKMSMCQTRRFYRTQSGLPF